MMHGENGQVSVPPGFRFHPTDEELLYYYLKKKVSYEAIDLDVIREVDLNKLEPWDLREKCRIGTGPQNEWYLFSHKDKKYPTGTRTNRATAAGFWKATGRDKPIFLSNSKRIGMRKTLVFYTGRAPHGNKTDWIMHEYRLDDDLHQLSDPQQQEEGWVVCRVFKKKNQVRGFQSVDVDQEEAQEADYNPHHSRSIGTTSANPLMPKQHFQHHHQSPNYAYPFDGASLNLPHLSSPDSAMHPPLPPPTSAFLSPMSLSNVDLGCSQNLLRLTSAGPTLIQPEHHKLNGDHWFSLDKLLTNYQSMEQQSKDGHHHAPPPPPQMVVGMDASGEHGQKFPFHYLGCEADVLKYSK